MQKIIQHSTTIYTTLTDTQYIITLTVIKRKETALLPPFFSLPTI